MDAQDMASLMLKGKNPLNAALGIAVCNVAADYDALSSKVADAADAFAARADDVVGMVGNIKPVAKQLKPKVERLIIFDRAESQGVYPEEQQKELLPQ